MATNIIQKVYVYLRIKGDTETDIVVDENNVKDDRGSVLTFDKVFDPTINQEQLYLNLRPGIMNDLRDGLSVCLVAFGYSGAGKFDTLCGKFDKKSNYGIIPRILKDIFDLREKITIQYMECINEKTLRDLLGNKIENSVTKVFTTSKNIRFHKDSMQSLELKTPEEGLQFYQKCSEKRIRVNTDNNPESTRMHGAFFINVGYDQQVVLLDLAGYENVVAADGSNISSSINLDLLSIENSISNYKSDLLIKTQDPNKKHTLKVSRESFISCFISQTLIKNNFRTHFLMCIHPLISDWHKTEKTLKVLRALYSIRHREIPQELQGYQQADAEQKESIEIQRLLNENQRLLVENQQLKAELRRVGEFLNEKQQLVHDFQSTTTINQRLVAENQRLTARVHRISAVVPIISADNWIEAYDDKLINNDEDEDSNNNNIHGGDDDDDDDENNVDRNNNNIHDVDDDDNNNNDDYDEDEDDNNNVDDDENDEDNNNNVDDDENDEDNNNDDFDDNDDDEVNYILNDSPLPFDNSRLAKYHIEDRMMIALALIYNNSWTKIQKDFKTFFPNKSSEKIRKRIYTLRRGNEALLNKWEAEVTKKLGMPLPQPIIYQELKNRVKLIRKMKKLDGVVVVV